MNEKHIERKLVEAVKKSGGLAPKFVSPGWDGVPNRIVLLPCGRMAFVELKAPGENNADFADQEKKTAGKAGL